VCFVNDRKYDDRSGGNSADLQPVSLGFYLKHSIYSQSQNIAHYIPIHIFMR